MKVKYILLLFDLNQMKLEPIVLEQILQVKYQRSHFKN